MYFGAGYEWFVLDELSVGALFRFVYAPFKINDVKYNVIEPGILATITFN